MMAVIKSPLPLLTKLFITIFILGATLSFAQSLGELARQERARKQTPSATSSRVYTNEDLARPRILHPPERERNTAAAPAAVRPNAESDRTSAARPWPLEVPLGDVAHFYRQLKQAPPLPEQDGTQQAREAQAPWLPTPAPQNAGSAGRALPQQERGASRQPVTREPLPTYRQVRVRRGDSLWKLASRHLGNGNEWKQIAALNPEIIDPNLLRVGQQLRLPGEAAPAMAAQVRVQAGDSLWRLAEAQWGDGQAWSCIAAANPQITEANHIFPGQLLTLPTTCAGIA